ncbi:MAG: hypothetical protein AAB368_09310, partial [bacterium]
HLDDVRLYNRALSSTEVYQLYNANVFTRFFVIEEMCRTTDASGTITGVAPCGGGTAIDPSVHLVTAVTQWEGGTRTGEVRASDIVARAMNQVFYQSDWSGGASTPGPLTVPGSGYWSATNVDVATSGGSIRIHGL